MRAVVQRARYGRVTVAGQVIGEIGPGLVVLLGVGQDDGEEDARYLAEKIAHLRIFPDQEGKLNLSVKDSGGEVLLVSQFTLYGDCRKGRRPSFTEAAPPEQALALYERVRVLLEEQGLSVVTGQFQAEMLVELANDGPVTMLLDSKRIF
ncbi:D-aminoacyl-tRNA deacylase [Carboxydocella sp. JDF658]|uniref:D-aminoacyl-tRNA deacylase n=1 Tax=Carboxydocella sp. JDF658 TaxID=1926600 RepID=UPI0009AD8CF4|nr:D-aminoacyl-tRNA deacylase [Carboxydocella sp. JDF658]GAW32590.1 D-aminoacyl-tRNA deacylase [Carboxydocella sp. JDF658]